MILIGKGEGEFFFDFIGEICVFVVNDKSLMVVIWVVVICVVMILVCVVLVDCEIVCEVLFGGDRVLGDY